MAMDLDGLSGILHYRFKDPALLRRALTHPSAPAVVNGNEPSYQRFEFLGDRVLGMVIADQVFYAFPAADEGELSRRLTRLVRKEACARVASEIGLGAHVIMGSGEAKSGGRRKKAILGDVCEAVIAALYLDGGMEAASGFIRREWARFSEEPVARLRDAKTALQEWAHRRGLDTPSYTVIDRGGPDHSPVFTTEVVVPGLASETATGSSKREAEQEAATRLLVREGEWAE